MKRTFYARYSLWIIVAVVFLLPLNAGGALRALRSNKQNFRDWLPANFPQTVDYNWFAEYFPGEQFVLMSWDGCTLDNPQKLRLLAAKIRSPQHTNDAGDPLFLDVVTGEEVLATLEERLERDRDVGDARQAALDRLAGCLVGLDRNQTCAVISLTPAGVDNLRKTIGEIYSVAVDECALKRDAIRMGGPPVDNVTIEIEGERTIYRLAGVCAIAGLAIAYWCVRSARMVLAVFYGAIYAAGICLGIVYYAGFHMNAVLMSMPPLVYIMTISGAIHIANYYRDAVNESGIATAPGTAVRHGFWPCTLAAFTTAVGLGSLYVSDIVPIKLFGLFSALGVMAALPLLFLFLPATFELFPLPTRRKKEASKENGAPQAEVVAGKAPRSFQGFWDSVAQLVLRRHNLVIASCVAVMVFFGWGLTRIETSISLMKLLSPEVELVQHYRWLEQKLGPLVPMEVVLRFDDDCELPMIDRLKLTRVVESRVHTFDEVGSMMSPVTFSPDPPTRAEFPRSRRGIGSVVEKFTGDPYERACDIFNRRLVEHRRELLDGGYLADGDGEELWRISVRVQALEEIDYGVFVDDFKARIDPILANLKARGVEGVSVKYTGLVPLIYQVQRSTLDGLIESFVLAFLVIALVMVVLFRGLVAGLLSMVPNIFPAIVIFGLMGWTGRVVDIGAMMTASVALGVAVDDTIHFMNWFREGLRDGLNRTEAVLEAYRSCAAAMTQTTLIAGVGLGVFAFSSFTPTQTFGQMLPTLLVAALVGDLLLLPAMLVSPAGHFFSKGVKARTQQAGDTVPPETAEAVVEGPLSEPHLHSNSSRPSIQA